MSKDHFLLYINKLNKHLLRMIYNQFPLFYLFKTRDSTCCMEMMMKLDGNYILKIVFVRRRERVGLTSKRKKRVRI